MKRYRIGKDVANRIMVRTNGEYTPLAGRDISLQMTDPKGCKTWENFTILEDGRMFFTYYGKDQKYTGTYQLTVWENFGKIGQTAVDCMDAFRLVANTTLEGGQDPEGLDTEVNDLELDLQTGIGGGSGDTNVIEIVKVNGTALTPDSNKAVDVPVPTEQTVSGWGFTKNTGTYSKPSTGIPKTDLESSVQTSLGKADSALQSFTETDPTVPSWAKQPTKPSYTASEVGALPSSTTIPTKTSDLTNDSGFITGYTETDPTVPSWAKQSTKPTYTASEVGALPASTTIPSALADLSDDSTHRTVTDTEKSTWNAKGTYSKPSGGIPASDIASGVIPTVPSNVSAFSNDAHYVASTAITTIVSMTQAQYDALATKDANTLYVIV